MHVISTNSTPLLCRSIMNLFGVLKYKKMGEEFVRNSGIPYTIIRFEYLFPNGGRFFIVKALFGFHKNASFFASNLLLIPELVD